MIDFCLGIPLYVFGPETHMTSICGMALGTRPIPQENSVEFATANFLLPSGDKSDKGSGSSSGGAESVIDGLQTAPTPTERVSVCTAPLVIFFFFYLAYFGVSYFCIRLLVYYFFFFFFTKTIIIIRRRTVFFFL